MIPECPQGSSLREEAAVGGPLERGAVDAQVRDLPHPPEQVLVEVGVILKGEPAQSVFFDIAHAVLDLALGPCPVGLAGPWARPPVVTKGCELRMEHRLPPGLTQDQ